MTSFDEPIGGYRILKTLGEGGMGVVYLAEQREPIRRRVALKLIKVGMDTEQVLRRFELERQSLALMEHDGIARVFDAGSTAEGRPFFVMEYVDGAPIDKHCNLNHLSVRERVELFREVCMAIDHAHGKGVVHRDLKPSNILVAEQDGRARPKVIDFGLAQATHRGRADETLFTEEGVLIGTPEYMSPEQASDANIDARTDVYSLGVVLYELLVGRSPLGSTTRRNVGFLEIRRCILEDDPPKPSAAVTMDEAQAEAITSQRNTRMRDLLADLRGDLDWILLKAMSKQPHARYRSAAEFADDLSRHLADEPILASKPTFSSWTRKLLRRKKNQLAIGGLALALVIGGSMFATYAATRPLSAIDAHDYVQRALAAEAALYPPTAVSEPEFDEWERTYAPTLRSTLTQSQLDGETARHSVFKTIELLLERESLQRASIARLRAAAEQSAPAWQAALEDSLVRASLGAPIDALVPIGRNPASDLWEFHHVPSSAGRVGPPAPRADGTYEIRPQDGVIFILVPPQDAHGEAFLLGRYEVTQAQWQRLSYGEQPSQFYVGAQLPDSDEIATAIHPVESVGWRHAHAVLRWHGLRFPESSEWMHAARAGADPSQPFGEFGRDELATYANLYDATSSAWFAVQAPERRKGDSWEDGSIWIARVGSYRPNRFGFHDMIGNLLEWCADRPPGNDEERICRGGSHDTVAAESKIEFERFGLESDVGASPTVGLRLALDPEAFLRDPQTTR